VTPTIYANFDHRPDEDVKRQAMDRPGEKFGHAAWNFFGYVSYQDGIWREEVWRFNEHIDTVEAADLMEVIREANQRYGSD
jgi:hypothetical protein